MSNTNYTGWGSSLYDASYNPSVSGSWRGGNSSQNEQYNPLYPSLNGTSNIFSSSSQGNDLRYFPSKKSNFQAAKTAKKAKKGAKPPNQKPNLVLVEIDSKPPISKQPNQQAGTTESPKTAVKVARVKKNNGVKKDVNGARKAVAKMPNYKGLQQQNQGNANWGYGGGARGGWRGRGRGRGGFRRWTPRAHNSKDDIPFVPLENNAPTIDLLCKADNIVAFHGFDSVFTTQHNFPVLIDGKIYTSCDHYYQIRKVHDLTGTLSEKLNDSVRDDSGKAINGNAVNTDKKSYSGIAKEVLKAANIDKAKVEEWRNTKGLEAIQTALLCKVSQSAHLREALKETGDHILVHAYSGDSIYGTGCTVPKIKKWLEDLENTGVKSLQVPATFPLTVDTVKNCPVFAQGRNILGVILMQLRDKVRKNKIEIVDMSKIFNALRVTDHAEDVTMESGNGFSVGGGTGVF